MLQAPELPAFTARLGDRALFPDLRPWAYLNHAGVSPLSRATRAAIGLAVQDYAQEGLGAVGRWVAQRARLKEGLADLLGVAAADLGLVSNTSAGLQAVALGMPWQAGDAVVVFEGEFPANVTPWQQAAALFGLTVHFASLAPLALPGGADLGPLEALLKGGRVRLVALSAVQFQTGLRAPLDAVAQLCHAHGAVLCVDAVQAVGLVPFWAGSADFVAASGHKWLMGPEGTGFFYLNPERRVTLRPAVASWLSHESPVDFLVEGPGHLRYDKPVRTAADFVEGGANNALGFAGLEASVALIRQVGRHRIFAHVQVYLDKLEAGLVARGFKSLRLADIGRRSGILAVEPPAGLAVGALAAGLRKRGVAVGTPDGRMRLAPHWPNGMKEPERVLEALDEALAEARGVVPPTLVDLAQARRQES